MLSLSANGRGFSLNFCIDTLVLRRCSASSFEMLYLLDRLRVLVQPIVYIFEIVIDFVEGLLYWRLCL